MTVGTTDEGYLLTVLNSTPVVDGEPVDRLGDAASARTWLSSVGGSGSPRELTHLRRVRDALQEVVRGRERAGVLAPELSGVTRVPTVEADGVGWALDVPHDRGMAVRAILAWSELNEHSPGRLRPCANPECRRFLIDHSKANSARWCSMAICGNRMKARRHYQRIRSDA